MCRSPCGLLGVGVRPGRSGRVRCGSRPAEQEEARGLRPATGTAAAHACRPRSYPPLSVRVQCPVPSVQCTYHTYLASCLPGPPHSRGLCMPSAFALCPTYFSATRLEAEMTRGCGCPSQHLASCPDHPDLAPSPLPPIFPVLAPHTRGCIHYNFFSEPFILLL